MNTDNTADNSAESSVSPALPWEQPSAPAAVLQSPRCSIRIDRPATCVLLLTVNGLAPKRLEEPLLQQVLAACDQSYHLELFVDLERAKRFPVTTDAWIRFINAHPTSFGRIYLFTTSRENALAAAIVEHLVERRDLITVITERPVFEACLALASGRLEKASSLDDAAPQAA